jgi:integrase
MEAKFYLRKKDAKGFFTIYTFASINGKQVYATTGIKVREEEWNSKKQMTKTNEAVNDHLRTISKAVASFAVELGKFDPSNDLLKRYLTLHVTQANMPANKPSKPIPAPVQKAAAPKAPRTPKVKQTPFFAVIDKFIKEAPYRLNGNGERITDNRLSMYNHHREVLHQFENHLGKPLSFEGFDKNVLTAFQTYLTKKGLANNTVIRYLRMLYVFLRYAEDSCGLEVNQAFRKFKTHANKKDVVVLNEQEIERIWNYQCDNPYEDNVRKLFLIGLHTGLRFSDYSSLSTWNFNKQEGILNLIQQKTGARVTLPLHPRLAQMLETEALPHEISNQKFNEYLKKLMQKIGFEQIIEVKKIIGGKRVIEHHPKWELISSHTARRSFATNLYKAGVNPSIIMLCTGHRDLSSFMKYIVLDNNDKLQVVRNLWNSTAI